MQFDPKEQMKPLVLAGCGFLAFIFAAAGSGTPFAVVGNDDAKAKYTFYGGEHCVKDTCTEVSYDGLGDNCPDLVHGMNAAAAFCIMAVLALLAATGMALATIKVEMLQKFVAAPFAVSAFLLFISWPITFGVYSSIKCGDRTISESNEAGVGPSGILQLFAWFICLGAIGASFALPNPSVGKSQPSSSQPNVNSLSAEML